MNARLQSFAELERERDRYREALEKIVEATRKEAIEALRERLMLEDHGDAWAHTVGTVGAIAAMALPRRAGADPR